MVNHQKGPPVTITITIDLDPRNGALEDQLGTTLHALGYVRQRPGYEMKRVITGNAQLDHQTMVEAEGEQREGKGAGPSIKVPGEPITDEQARELVAEARKRGQPSPGKGRRTKAEIAEDEAADKADADLKAAGEKTGAVVPDKQVEDVVDSAEDQAQDAADEAAETAGTATGKLTHDDVRKALKGYVTAYGMAAAQQDGPKLIAKVLGKEHVDIAPLKISDIPEDLLQVAVDGAQEMIEKNPFKREKVAGEQVAA